MMTNTTATSTLKATPLKDTHIQRGGKMVDFSGWEMPLQFTRVLEEHMAVRKAAGLFDVSHMGIVVVKSGDVETTRHFLNGLVGQDLTKLYPGKAAYTQFLNESGGILDDIIVYMLPEELQDTTGDAFSGFNEFMVVVNAANVEQDLAWMAKHAEGKGIRIELKSADYSLVALQGPAFEDVLSYFSFAPENLPKRFHLTGGTVANVPVILARTGYTGEDGVEMVVPNDQVATLWNTLLDEGGQFGLVPVGLAARDTLRLEAALPLHGHDITPETTPLEAGLGWSVKLKQEADFIGKDALKREKEAGSKRQFVCFKLHKKAIAREHDKILKDGNVIGEVTSGSISPMTNEPIGMGYVTAHSVTGSGDTIQLEIRNKPVDGEIVDRPFYKP